MDIEISVRAATEADVPAIRDIYNYEVLHGTATFDTDDLPPAQLTYRGCPRAPGNVGHRAKSGKLMLALSLTAFDPNRTS